MTSADNKGKSSPIPTSGGSETHPRSWWSRADQGDHWWKKKKGQLSSSAPNHHGDTGSSSPMSMSPPTTDSSSSKDSKVTSLPASPASHFAHDGRMGQGQGLSFDEDDLLMSIWAS